MHIVAVAARIFDLDSRLAVIPGRSRNRKHPRSTNGE